MKILFVGHGRAGKDEAGEYLGQVSRLKFAGTTSKYLTKYVASQLGLSEEEAYLTRHQHRETWRRIGDEVREHDPAFLIKEALAHGDISGGIRGLPEIVAARDIVDLIIWVDNNRVPKDPTVEFDESQADLVIPNHWSLAEYHFRLERLARVLKIHKQQRPDVSIFDPWVAN